MKFSIVAGSKRDWIRPSTGYAEGYGYAFGDRAYTIEIVGTATGTATESVRGSRIVHSAASATGVGTATGTGATV